MIFRRPSITLSLILFFYSSQYLLATNYYTRDSPPSRGCFGLTSFSNTSHSGAAGSTPPTTVPAGDTIFANHMGCTTVDSSGSGTSSGCDCTFGPSQLAGTLIVRSGARFVWNGSMNILAGGSVIVESGGTLELNGSIVSNVGSSIEVNGRLEMNGSVSNNIGITGTGCFVCNGSITNSGSGDFFGDPTTPIPCAAGANCTNTVLPVTLLSFDAISHDEGIQLSWITLTEINNSHFTLYKSVDGLHYEIITTIEGNGTSSSVNHYQFIDHSNTSGISYYRLQQTDFDGTTETFPPVSIYTKPDGFDFHIINQRMGNEIEIYFQELEGEKVAIQLYSLNGQLINSFQLDNTKTYSHHSLNGLELSESVYVLVAICGDQVKSKKFVKF